MFSQPEQEKFIKLTQALVQKAIDSGNPPFAAILVNKDGKVVGEAFNTRNSDNDPVAHAEINLLRKVAKKLGSWNLEGLSLFSNADSCPMCMVGALKANIKDFYFGASFEKDSDPLLSPLDIVSKSKKNINLRQGILKKDCERQIVDGRKALHIQK